MITSQKSLRANLRGGHHACGVIGVYRIASFIGIAPIDDPRIVVAVVLDSPRGETEDGSDMRFGGVSAAPIFAEVAEAALHRLGVPPNVR